MYSCPKRHNILAPKQGYLTAFHSVVGFFILFFLLYMTYSIFEPAYIRVCGKKKDRM